MPDTTAAGSCKSVATHWDRACPNCGVTRYAATKCIRSAYMQGYGGKLRPTRPQALKRKVDADTWRGRSNLLSPTAGHEIEPPSFHCWAWSTMLCSRPRLGAHDAGAATSLGTHRPTYGRQPTALIDEHEDRDGSPARGAAALMSGPGLLKRQCAEHLFRQLLGGKSIFGARERCSWFAQRVHPVLALLASMPENFDAGASAGLT